MAAFFPGSAVCFLFDVKHAPHRPLGRSALYDADGLFAGQHVKIVVGEDGVPVRPVDFHHAGIAFRADRQILPVLDDAQLRVLKGEVFGRAEQGGGR